MKPICWVPPVGLGLGIRHFGQQDDGQAAIKCSSSTACQSHLEVRPGAIG